MPTDDSPRQEPFEALAARLYDELRRLARARMADLPPGQTLQPTSLVNEVFLRLQAEGGKGWDSEVEFFGAAAEAMRRVLVDYARGKHAEKRGGGWKRQELESIGLEVQTSPERILEINESLEALDEDDQELATIVKLRVFFGMTAEEIAALLEVSRKTVERRWRFAAATLRIRWDEWSGDKKGPQP